MSCHPKRARGYKRLANLSKPLEVRYGDNYIHETLLMYTSKDTKDFIRPTYYVIIHSKYTRH